MSSIVWDELCCINCDDVLYRCETVRKTYCATRRACARLRGRPYVTCSSCNTLLAAPVHILLRWDHAHTNISTNFSNKSSGTQADIHVTFRTSVSATHCWIPRLGMAVTVSAEQSPSWQSDRRSATSNSLLFMEHGARGSAVEWGTRLQVGMSRVRFPTGVIGFLIVLIIPVALRPWGILDLLTEFFLTLLLAISITQIL
jgi:hypothetical protein